MELCYHKPPEFAKLLNKQIEELLELCPVNKFRGKSGYKGNGRGDKRNSHGYGSRKGKETYDKRIKGQVAPAIKKQRNEDKMDQEKETEELADLVKIILSTHPASNSSTTDGKADTSSATVKLNAIIKSRRKP